MKADTIDVVADTFLILNTPVFTLIDLGLTLYDICNKVFTDKGWDSVKTNFDMVISNLLGNCVVVNKV